MAKTKKATAKYRGHYWANAFQCPFYSSDERTAVICEGRCAVRFYTQREAGEYIKTYCANRDHGWEKCSIAMMLTKHYEEGL